MLLDKPFVDRICKDQIAKFKSAQIENFHLPIPHYHWIQNDPDLLKEKELTLEFHKASLYFLNAKDIDEQKKKLKRTIYTCMQVEAQLNFVLLFPNPENYDDLRFKSFDKLNDQNLKNFLRYLSTQDPILSKKGITDQINFENAAIIAQEFSINVLLNFILQDCIRNLGVGKINAQVLSLGTNMLKEVANFIPKLKSDGSIDLKEFSVKDKIKTIFNMSVENQFIEKDG